MFAGNRQKTDFEKHLKRRFEWHIIGRKNKTAEIKVTYEGVDDPFVYYVEVQGKYYQMHSDKGFITIDNRVWQRSVRS